VPAPELIYLRYQTLVIGQLKKWVLSHRDSTEMISRIESALNLSMDLPKSAQARCAEPEDGVVFIGLDGFEFVQSGDRFLPFLGSPGTLALFPAAVVDEGAIRFLLNGADVMRPGIRKLDDWGEAGRVVVVKEEKKGRAIAVGESMVSSAEARGMAKGGCIRNLHHVGDRFWSLHRSV
jgi:malignant T-cell-amplified sequence